MNLHRHSHSFDRIPAVPWRSHAGQNRPINSSSSTAPCIDPFSDLSSMQPLTSSMSSAPHDARNMADDRIRLQESRRPVRDLSGGAVLVQPSFDDAVERSKTPVASSPSKVDWQARSPNQEGKQGDTEPRNPSSPPSADNERSMSVGHERQLSAHFFDATTLSDGSSPDHPTVGFGDDKFAGRKHRRMFSGDLANPPMAHRRINSIGNTAAVERQQQGTGERQRQHHRVDSAGLDILSAAVKDELSAVSRGPMPTTVSSLHQQQPMLSSVPPPHDQHRYSSAPPGSNQHMHPPEQRRMPSYPTQYAQQRPSYPSTSQYQPSSYSYHPSPQAYPLQQQRSMPPHSGYPAQYAQRPPPAYSKAPYPQERMHDPTVYDKKGAPRSEWSTTIANHQGSQTFVTAMAVGSGNRALNAKDDIPSQVGHHRKMSSLSSLGQVFGSSSVFNPDQSQGHPLKSSSHHRSTSSTISFLPGFDVGLDTTDEAFLRNLHASNSTTISGATEQPAAAPKQQPAAVPTKLAAGGTSKRVRRKCNVEGCPNRVVQGGLCISHGAKRKTCKHPGCHKNVKKAGLCSTHGPARKRCEAPNCSKVAVQGGRCIAHGAKKRMCSVPDCTKQAILSGMCKKHHDKASKTTGLVCQEVSSSGSKKPTHARGLSIFQEMSADAVQSILLEDGTEDPDAAQPPRTSSSSSSNNMW